MTFQSFIFQAFARISKEPEDPREPNEPAEPWLKEVKLFLEVLNRQLYQRFPFKGSKVHAYAVAHLLHPWYRGATLEICMNFVQTFEKIIEDHPSTAEFKARSAAPGLDDAMVMDVDDDDLNQYVATQLAQKTGADNDQQLPPIHLELNMYLGKERPDEKDQVDVLKWWKQNAAQFPLLSQLAR